MRLEMKRFSFSISTRIFVGLLLMLALVGGISLWSVYKVRDIGDHLRLMRHFYRLTKRVSQLEIVLQNNQADLERLFSKPWKDDEQKILQRLLGSPIASGKVEAALGLVGRIALRLSPQDQQFLRRLQAHFREIDRLLVLYQKALQEIALEGWKSATALAGRKQKLSALDGALIREIRLLGVQLDFRPLQDVLRAEEEERRTTLTLVILSSGALLLSLTVIVVSLLPLRKIRLLAEWTHQIAQGDFSKSPPYVPLSQSRDEIGHLVEDFRQMVAALEERDQHLARQRQALEEAYTDLQSSSERLLRSERLAAIGRLAAQITHEVRNPLNAIGLNLELLEEDLQGLPDPTEAIAVLKSTVEEVERLTQITEEYLRFARLPPPQLERSDLNALLSDLMEFLQAEMRSRGVATTMELFRPLPPINIDQRQIRQALLNLLRNAMEAALAVASQRPPTIHLSTRQTEEGVFLTIADNGIGIQPDQQTKIFDPFFSTKEGGSGLGLPLTQQIIAGHGGQLLCESRADHGTTFVMIFPQETDNATPSTKSRL